MKKFVLCLAVLSASVALCVAPCAAQEAKESFSRITVDTISFEEDGLLTVFDNDGNTIVKFDRFENKNAQGVDLKNARVYGTDGALLMTIVVNIDGSRKQLHLQDSAKKRGLVEIETSLGLGTVTPGVTVQYFGKGYEMSATVKIGVKGTERTKVVTFGGKTAFKTAYKSSIKGRSESSISVENSYLAENRVEAGVWALILFMCEELGY
ncbi:MAG TPA: hypothetical protein PLU93_09010 [Treponemataceae bacterium]|nr:hypothetical protein [Treponemataceae bacterium]